MIFGCGPVTLLGASRMVLVQHDLEMVALIAGESDGGKPHYRNGIPFQPFDWCTVISSTSTGASGRLAASSSTEAR